MAVARQQTGTAELDEALSSIAGRAADLAKADVVVVRLADEHGMLVAHAVHSVSESVRAELESSRIELDALSAGEDPETGALAPPLRLAAERLSAVGVLQLPVRENGAVVGAVELMRRQTGFDERQRELARAIADEVALVRRAFSLSDAAGLAPDPLELAGDALAAAADETQAAEQVAALAAEATGAHAAFLWRYDGDEEVLAAVAGPAAPDTAARAVAAAHQARQGHDPVTVETLPDGAVATLQLGEPPIGALQLVLHEAPLPSDPMLPRLATFAVRAAHMLRVAERRRVLAEELERSRALLAIVGQAISELSLAHTLDTAVARVCELLSADRLAVYLLDSGRLETAAECGLTGPHARIGERMLELALGPGRARGLVFVPDASDERLDGVRGAVEELGIESVLGVPLRSGDELVGLLAAYLERGRPMTANEESLLLALASQLAVAVQNARLHEDVEREKEEAKRERDRAEAVSRRLQALYDISRSFTESLSLRRTLDAIVESIVTSLGVDAAVLRTPNERGDSLVPVATHVRDDRLAEPIKQMLSLQQPLSPRRPSVHRGSEPVVLDAARAREHGPAHEPLIPFLEKGSSAAVIPLVSPRDEVLGTLTLLSLDSEHEITKELLQDALSIAGPAALALDNARLHQERQEFTETMQRSLLPQTRPELEGLDIGHVYAPSTRVEVGGDVYDFLELADGRLAVVLGDVSGHGIDAAADMAMTKFVFRSLVRDHPEPGDLLAAANEVVLGEVGAGRFVTMLCLTIDPRSGELACASAGHPPPRLLTPGRGPEQVSVSGLALGVESGQRYETTRLRLEPGTAAVLFTDGLLEARRDGELYGEHRLDRALERHAELDAPELARALVEDCHAFAPDLHDDLAVVVLKRT
ncbi:MAG: GAF domain-containing protein [Actinobacteria bacterium]|nr:MAG: GAF domain-containing protein [Actinomycetota bacterium]